MKCRIAVWLLPLAAFTNLRAADEPTVDLGPLDILIAAGDYSRGLAEARRLLEALPIEARLTAWELDFRGEVVRAVPGKRHLYYQLSIPNSHKDAPGREQALPSIRANKSRSDWRHVVICLDLISGKIRWSREVNGLVNIAVAPGTDDVYLWRELLLQLDANNGEVTLERDLPGDQRAIAGLIVGNKVAIPQLYTHGREILTQGKLLFYDPRRDLAEEREVGEFFLLAPDESCRLVHRDDGWSCVELPSDRTLWRWPKPDFVLPPIWQDDCLLTYSGSDSSHGTISAVDTATGQRRWTTRLGWGAYSIRQHQLRGGGYPDEDWGPLAPLGRDLLTIDGSGRVVLLDAERGDVRVSVKLARNHLCLPPHIGQTLVVCSFDWVRAFPLPTLTDPLACGEATLRLREARCLVGLGRHDEALATLDRVVDRAPNHYAAWALRAEVCRALKRGSETSFSLCMAMALQGRTQDDALHDGWGLVRLFDLGGRPAWEVQQLGGRVYAGTQGGRLWSVDLDSLEARWEQNVDGAIASLGLRANLNAVIRSAQRSDEPIDLLLPDRPPRDGVPREWWTMGGEKRVGAAVSYRDRQFRPMKGGGVRVLDGTEMRELPGRLQDVGVWRIHLSSEGPLGYGEGGVFELDEDIRPQRVLYRPVVGGEAPERVDVQFLRRTAETIGMVVASDKGAALQVCSRDGRLLGEAPLGRFVSRFPRKDQLIAIGEGYLLSDRQLTWVGPEPRQVWQFGPALSRTSTERWGDRWRYFGIPSLAQGKLYVTSLDGHLLVFDPMRIRRATARQKTE